VSFYFGYNWRSGLDAFKYITYYKNKNDIYEIKIKIIL